MRQIWNADLATFSLLDGQCLNILVIICEDTRECVAVEVLRDINKDEVVGTLTRLVASHYRPAAITVDRSAIFSSKTLSEWAFWNKVALSYAKNPCTGKLTAERVIHKLRRECLERFSFTSLESAIQKIQQWRLHYNEMRRNPA